MSAIQSLLSLKASRCGDSRGADVSDCYQAQPRSSNDPCVLRTVTRTSCSMRSFLKICLYYFTRSTISKSQLRCPSSMKAKCFGFSIVFVVGGLKRILPAWFIVFVFQRHSQPLERKQLGRRVYLYVRTKAHHRALGKGSVDSCWIEWHTKNQSSMPSLSGTVGEAEMEIVGLVFEQSKYFSFTKDAKFPHLGPDIWPSLLIDPRYFLCYFYFMLRFK